jgi:TRAP-type uncharacterized transport system fused permease subunit
MFVYGPPLLLDGAPHAIALAIMTALIGVTGLAAAVIGYARRPLAWWERCVAAVAAAALIFPGVPTDAFGIVVLAFVFRRGALQPVVASALPQETAALMTKT